MKIPAEDVQHIARLSRIALTHEDVEKFAESLGTVFTFVDQLKEVDVTDVMETNQVTGLHNVFRTDEVIACDPQIRAAIIKQFPVQRGGLLEVPGIFS